MEKILVPKKWLLRLVELADNVRLIEYEPLKSSIFFHLLGYIHSVDEILKSDVSKNQFLESGVSKNHQVVRRAVPKEKKIDGPAITHPFQTPAEGCRICGVNELDHYWKCEKCGMAGNGEDGHRCLAKKIV